MLHRSRAGFELAYLRITGPPLFPLSYRTKVDLEQLLPFNSMKHFMNTKHSVLADEHCFIHNQFHTYLNSFTEIKRNFQYLWSFKTVFRIFSTFSFHFAAAGEPPQCMSCSCLFAVQDAIYHAREETGNDSEYFPLDGPATVEATQLKCLVDPSQFIL